MIQGLGWLLLGLASLIVPRSWQDNPAGPGALRWRERWHLWNYGNSAERQAFRGRLLDINAFFWLAARTRLKPALVWGSIVILGCLWSWGLMEERRGWLISGEYFFTALVLNTILKTWIASEAGRRFGEDRKIGAFELLLSTPLSVGDILRGQVLALKRQFLGPIIFALIVEGVFLLATFSMPDSHGIERAGIVSYGLAIMTMLVADALACGVVGMWIGLTAKNPNRATGMTLRRILVLPWGVIWILMILASVVHFPSLHNDGDFEKAFLALYFAAGIITDLAFGAVAWRRLRTEFRAVAVQRFTPEMSLWDRLWRRGVERQPTLPSAGAS